MDQMCIVLNQKDELFSMKIVLTLRSQMAQIIYVPF